MKISSRSPNNSRVSLSENESKNLLASYNVPVVKEVVVEDLETATLKAAEMGYPVVIKGLGATLLHKTERNLVHLHLQNSHDIEAAVHAIKAEAGDELEGFLVQPQIIGKREFVAGLFRDYQFGPVIMFGLGGIFTEALSDVSFRLAPLSEADISDMLSEIRAKKLLKAFRGESAINAKQLRQTLLGLSQLSIEHPDVAEIDINPLLSDASGNLYAVDALVIKSTNSRKKEIPPPISPKNINSFFHPKPIAFIGASSAMGKWGYTLPVNTISGGYENEIYLVNPKGSDILGRKTYTSIAEIPGNVDLAVVTIPAAKVMDLIPQFKDKGIADMLLISSGFSETGEEGRRLEKELITKSREAGILVLGPNTMGICNPHIKLYCTGALLRNDPGSISIVSQSGNMGTQLLDFAQQQGIGIRGFCGSGNEAMVTIEDFLDAFAEDPLTKMVSLYVESVKNGRRFFEAAQKLGKSKPLVLLKGGQSEAGNIAAASHTGAMTSDTKVFTAMCRQSGIIKVNQSLEMLDLAACFSSLPLPKGNRVAVMTLGGGWGVITADLCEYYGLRLPSLSPDIIKRIDNILPEYWSKANPLDLVGEKDNELPKIVLEELVTWEGCDAVINLGVMGKSNMAKHLLASVQLADPSCPTTLLDDIMADISAFESEYIAHNIRLMETYQKPIYGVSLMANDSQKTVHRITGGEYAAIFFPTPERAVKSLTRMVEYHDHLKRTGV